MDSFTCGICKLTFHQLDTFLEHKHKHDFQKQPSIRSGSPRSKTESLEHAFPNIKTSPVASSACNSSSFPFLNSVPRMECPSLHKDSSEILSQVSEYSVTPRSTMSCAVVSPHCNSVTSKSLDVSTSRLEVVAQRSQESTKSNLSNMCIETGSFEGEDGDIILIEISENKKQDGELRARVCRPNFEGSEISHRSSITRSEKQQPKNNEEESISSSCCSGHVNSKVGFECGISEEKSEHKQTHFSSNTSTWEDPADGRRKDVKSDSCLSSGHPYTSRSEDTSTESSSLSSVSHPIEMCITQSCNVFSTVQGGNKMIVENSRETERKLVHTSPQGRSWTSDAITYTTPSNVTHTTPAGLQDINYCQDKLSVNRSDITYDEYAYRDKPKVNLEVEGPCEDIPHEIDINKREGMSSEVQEQMENTRSKTYKKVVPGDRTIAEGEVPSSVRNEATVEAGNTCTEEIFVGHQDGSASNGSMTQGFGEGALLNSESMSLAPGDCSELEYTPSPGIYTLILNTDNTFSLVSEGCQAPATQTCNPVFVCWPCQKFAPSQAEILSHISANHPQDLSSINQCMFELSPLSPPHGNNTAEAVQHVNGRKVQRRLGRPRKEDLVNQKEPQPVRKKFKVEINGTLCLDCDKLFPKQRQFDKHRCSVWQDDQLPQDQLLSKHPTCPLTSVEEGAEEIFNIEALQKEGDEEEEWQRSATCKPRGRGAEKRKRGRPPKVDQLRGERVDNEESDEVLRERIDKQQPLTSSQSTLNSNAQHSSDMTQTVGPSRFQHIPTLPLFSNPHQKERLHKWIAQTDLSFVDDIIDKVYPEKKLSEKRVVPAMFTCRECKLLFRTLTSCRRHCAKHMTKKAFTCPDCDFATANVGGLYSHYRNHTQNLYACDKCDFRARIKAHYRDHLETHNPCRHVCRICQKPYSTSSSLRSHIYLNHRNEEGMKYVWWLRRKNQEQDKKNVVFQCPVCYQLFSELSLANEHLATHEHSVPQEVMRCEVCGLEPLSQGTFKKHLMKHKVVFICCTCGKPQVTASCLRSHLREGACSSYSRDDNLKLSFLYSYTTSGMLPSLMSSKVLGLGSLLQDMKNYINHHQQMPDTKVCSNLKHQMEAAGYKQISELLQEKLADLTATTCKTEREVMKIVISTRSGTDNK